MTFPCSRCLVGWLLTPYRYQLSPYGVQFTRAIYLSDLRLVVKKIAKAPNNIAWPLMAWTSGNGDSDP